jgi:hypothetical protein
MKWQYSAIKAQTKNGKERLLCLGTELTNSVNTKSAVVKSTRKVGNLGTQVGGGGKS